GLGDAFDRWWTGGGNIETFFFHSFFPKNNGDQQFKYSLNAGFDKFTGGGKTAINDPFKFANHILLKDVDYTGEDYNEIFYNRGVFFIGFGIGRFLFEFDVPIVEIDVQDIIHKIRIDSYHPKYESRKENLFRYLRYSFVPRVLFD
ncbi:MAG: hypothetical protein KDC44_19515, partial [Phaeodactylibacter sp.]|nr:hypothetical protein [Phaeodactylibacter sp.]